MDDEFGLGGAGSLLTAFPPRLGHHPAPHAGIGRKENAGQPSSWAGQRLAQAAATTGPLAPAAKLEVYCDDEEGEEEEVSCRCPGGWGGGRS